MVIAPNSNRSKQEKQVQEPAKLSPVIKGGARTKKKSLATRVGSSIISEDAQNVKSYIVMDVLVPAIKKAISDVVVNGIDIILYGEAGHTKKANNAGRVSYRSYYDNTTDRFSNTRSTSSNASRSGPVSLFDDIVVDSRVEATTILDRMTEYLEVYPVISVADMYDLANITNFPHTYNNYGWKSVAAAKVVRVNDGYLLKMPPVEPIK